mgnify:CR=1 FL=1
MGLFNKKELEKIEQLTKTINAYERNIKTLNKKIERLEQDKREDKKEYEEIIDYKDELIESKKAEIDMLNQEIKQLNDKMFGLKYLTDKVQLTVNNNGMIIKQLEREIGERKQQVEEVKQQMKEQAVRYQEEINEYKEEIKTLKEEMAINRVVMSQFEKRNNRLNKMENNNGTLEELEKQIATKEQYLNEVNAKIEEMENKAKGLEFLEEIGMNECPYEYETSEIFQNELNKVRDEQKEMIKENKALVFGTTWTIGKSEAKGKQFMKNLVKMALNSFNAQCDNIIMGLKYSSMATAKTKVEKIYNFINRTIKVISAEITNEYFELKVKELELKCGYLTKKEEEKEELRKQMEILREQEKAEKELEEAKKNIEKEEQHYNKEIAKLEKRLGKEKDNNEELLEQIAKLQAELNKLAEKKENVEYRTTHNKAGYVYIISNPSLEGMYKIGVTKRLDPMVRVNELSNASLPFEYGVHSFIFSENAFELEHTLHMAFDDKRINKVNRHKEFFSATLDEIKEEVYKYNSTAQFIDEVVIEDYMASMNI